MAVKVRMKQINNAKVINHACNIGLSLAVLAFVAFYMYLIRNMPLDW